MTNVSETAMFLENLSDNLQTKKHHTQITQQSRFSIKHPEIFNKVSGNIPEDDKTFMKTQWLNPKCDKRPGKYGNIITVYTEAAFV